MEAQQGGSIKVAQVAPKAPMAELPVDLAKKPLGYFRDKMRVFIIVRIRAVLMPRAYAWINRVCYTVMQWTAVLSAVVIRSVCWLYRIY